MPDKVRSQSADRLRDVFKHGNTSYKDNVDNHEIRTHDDDYHPSSDRMSPSDYLRLTAISNWQRNNNNVQRSHRTADREMMLDNRDRYNKGNYFSVNRNDCLLLDVRLGLNAYVRYLF